MRISTIVLALAMTSCFCVNAARAQSGEKLCQQLRINATAQSVSALGGVFERYEREFARNADLLWNMDRHDWEKANFYDRAKIYYVWYCRSRDPKFLERANAIAVDYRTHYIEKSNFGPAPHWSEMTGVALHFLATGDEASRSAVGRVADYYTRSYFMDHLADKNGEMDNRVQAKLLQAFLSAYLIKAPSLGNKAWGAPGGNDWGIMLRKSLEGILASQEPDGSFRYAAYGFNVKPFMLGMLNDSLIDYYEQFEKDPRIVQSIRRSVQYLWVKDWLPGAASFIYIERDHKDEKAEPAPGLNALVVSSFGFLLEQTGDPSFLIRGDEVLGGAVKGTWFASGKQFNQLYTASYKYLNYREAFLARGLAGKR